MEEWKTIPGHKGYEISSHGRVRSFHTQGRGNRLRSKPRLLYPVLRDRYLQITLNRTPLRIHVLVLKAFVGPKPPGPPRPHGRHLNDDPIDNYATNLKWGTGVDNAMDRHVNGNMLQGDAHPSAKLDADLVRLLRIDYANGEPICDLARQYGIHPETLRDAIQLRTWKHVV